MIGVRRRTSTTSLLRASVSVLYHVGVVTLSAGLALALPWIVRSMASNLLVYWSFIENEKMFLVSVEIALAIGFILFFNYVGRSWRDRRRSRIVESAGITRCVPPAAGWLTRRRIRTLKERHGVARDVMIMGSTGFRTFVDSTGDLHRAVQNCREARIMLLNPYGRGAQMRAKSIRAPEVTPKRFEEQIRGSIEFLRTLRAAQRKVRLKLYDDAPFLKLAILGEHIWMKHYHASLGVEAMPEYVLGHGPSPGDLYAVFYEYFLKRWEDPGVPELDLETEELVYRDGAGNELRREAFDKASSVFRRNSRS